MTFPLDPPLVTEDPAALASLRPRWGWIVAMGAISLFFGFAALVLVVSATVAAVYMIAIFMIIAGGIEITMGFSSRDWAHFFLWILAGLFYIIAGAFALAQPFDAAAVLTLALGLTLLVTGLVRIYFGFQVGKGMRGLLILAGLVTFVVGLLVILGWPSNSLVILGALLGLDLLFWGAGWIAFGLRLREGFSPKA